MNLLVLCTDTYRADYLGCYGNPWISTPRIDRLAAEGVRFADFHGEGLPTIPSRRVFYTGRRVFPFAYHPQKSDPVQLPGWHPLFEEDVTIAEWLADRGYTTALVSDLYHLMKPGKNFHRGFHSWEWIRGQEADHLTPTPKPDVDLSPYVHPQEPERSTLRLFSAQYLNNRVWWKDEADHYAAQVMRGAANWLRQWGHKRPWLLWVESFDPHEPWDPPREDAARYCANLDGLHLFWAPAFVKDCREGEFERIRANYAGECTHVDRWCGHVLDVLDEMGLADDTIVAFTSDHGTMMGEQGEIHKGHDRVRIQVTRSPLVIRNPRDPRAGTVVDGLAQQQDLMPTLLGLLGEPVPDRCDGADLWPFVTGEREGNAHDVAITGFGAYASVRTKEWNYQAAWTHPPHGTVRPPELYDRRSDPDELVNAIDRHPEVARALQARLDEALSRGPTAGSVGVTETPAAIPGVKW